MIANEPFGVGTRTALAVSLLSKEGITLVTAFPAPVSVITMFTAADLPRTVFYYACCPKDFGHLCMHVQFQYGHC